MDPIDLVKEIRKIISEKRIDISDVILTGGVEDYTNYSNLVGQLKSLDYVEQEVRDFLQKRRIDVDQE